MKYILARENLEILRQFAWSNTLLAFDFDGTLAPMNTDPAKAALRPATRRILSEIVTRYPTVVISGRAARDAAIRLNGVKLHGVSGNHGLEPWDRSARYERLVRRWSRALESTIRQHRGVWVEDKRFSLAIHYRKCREKRKAVETIRESLATLGAMRVIGGKQVINVLPDGAPHKGIAIERMRARFQCDTAIYVGDDETDEDVFALEEPGRLLTIRVGPSRRSLASYFIRSQRETDTLLRQLSAFRRRPDNRRVEHHEAIA